MNYQIEFNDIKRYIMETGNDIFHENENYNTSSFVYYCNNDSIEYMGMTKFIHEITKLLFPLMPLDLVESIFNFQLSFKIYNNQDMIQCRIKSDDRDLYSANVNIHNIYDDHDMTIHFENIKYIYQDKTPKIIENLIVIPLPMIIKKDILFFFDRVRIYIYSMKFK